MVSQIGLRERGGVVGGGGENLGKQMGGSGCRGSESVVLVISEGGGARDSTGSMVDVFRECLARGRSGGWVEQQRGCIRTVPFKFRAQDKEA